MKPASPQRLHRLLMELIRVIGLGELDRAAAGHAISLSQVFALHELDSDVPLSQRDLAERLHLEKSSVSRMAAEMERSGLLVRERYPDDRRLYRLRLTDRGRALHRGIGGAFHQRYLAWASAMTPAELDALAMGLEAMLRAVRGEPAPSPVDPRRRPAPRAT